MVRLSRKIRKLFSVQALESVWEHSVRLLHPVSARKILATVDREKMSKLREQYPFRPGSPPINRFEDADYWVPVNVERMIQHFLRGLADLGEIWDLALDQETARALRELGQMTDPQKFHLPDELWVRLVYDFAVAFEARQINPDHLLKSLTPAYMGRVASFVLETRDSTAFEVEEKIEQLCLLYEQWKPYLIERWPVGGQDDREPATNLVASRTAAD